MADKEKDPAAELEARINAKIIESGHALNREGARLVIEHQDANEAAAKKAAKK